MPKSDATALSTYTVDGPSGRTYTVRLTAEEAELRGAKPVEAQKAQTPANKSRTPANK